MKTLFGIIAFAVVSAPIAAQDAAKAPPANMVGNWDVSFTSPQGAATWRIKFEQSADTLWGTATTDFGPLAVTNGWVAGNDLSWSLNLDFSGQAITLNFTGTVKGDTINGQIDVPGVGIQPFAFTGVKATGTASGAPSPVMPAERPRPVAFAVRR